MKIIITAAIAATIGAGASYLVISNDLPQQAATMIENIMQDNTNKVCVTVAKTVDAGL